MHSLFICENIKYSNVYGLPIYLQNVYEGLYVVSDCKMLRWSEILRLCLNFRER